MIGSCWTLLPGKMGSLQMKGSTLGPQKAEPGRALPRQQEAQSQDHCSVAQSAALFSPELSLVLLLPRLSFQSAEVSFCPAVGQ